jgi:hypothetical protein
MNIYQSLAAAIKLVGEGGMSKEQYNEQQKYWFRGIDDVYNKLNPVLAKLGIVIVPTVVEHNVSEFTSAKGTKFTRAVLKVDYLLCATDASCLHAVFCGEALDTGDKAVAKALSMAYKSMAIQVFCIPVEGDEDADRDSPNAEDPPERIATPQAKPPAPASHPGPSEAPPVDPRGEDPRPTQERPAGTRKISPGEAAFLKRKAQEKGVEVQSIVDRFSLRALEDMDDATFKDVKAWLTK